MNMSPKVNSTRRSFQGIGTVATMATMLSLGSVGAFAQDEADATSASVIQSPFALLGSESSSEASGQVTEPWIFGVLGSPSKAAEINARGVRGIIDFNDFSYESGMEDLQHYVHFDMGVCLTLRWKDAEDSHFDRLPSDASVVDEKVDALIRVLQSEEAQSLSGRLWIQFFNEVTGGPGTIRAEDRASLFGFATETAARIRNETSGVMISGPALNGVQVLNADRSSLDAEEIDRVDAIEMALDWSLAHADAVDVHLHADGLGLARKRLSYVRAALDEREGGADMPLVAWEWSPARFSERDNGEGVQASIKQIWRTMNEYNVIHAAYGAYYPPLGLSEMFQWKNMMTVEGDVNQPVWDAFTAISADPAGEAGLDSSDGSSDDGRVSMASSKSSSSASVFGDATQANVISASSLGSQVTIAGSSMTEKERRAAEKAAAKAAKQLAKAEAKEAKAAAKAARAAEKAAAKEAKRLAKLEAKERKAAEKAAAKEAKRLAREASSESQ